MFQKIIAFILPLLFTVPAWAQNTDIVKAIGNQFAHAGIKAETVVPPFAQELSITKRQPAPGTPRPLPHESVYMYTGEAVTLVSAAQLNNYFENIFKAVKAVARDHKIYQTNPTGDTRLGPEIPEYMPVSKSFGSMNLLFNYNGKWYNLAVSHKVQYEKFVKEYPGKYCGTKFAIQKYNVTE